MPALSPSFHTIYRQGRFRARLAPESTDAIEQKERFAVACLASVLHHDKEFRADFLRRVCGWADGDAAADFEVWVEKSRCGDLGLESKILRVIFVLECKIGAPLQPNQSPDSDSFFTEGYGRGIAEEYQDSSGKPWQRFYITLEQSDNAKSYRSDRGIQCQAKRWDALSAQRTPADPASSWVDDLFHTLAAMQVHCFAAWDMKTRQMKLADQYFHACEIKELLQNTAALLKNHFQLHAAHADASALKTRHDSYIGRALLCKEASPAWQKFAGLKSPRPSDHLCWYGYAWGVVHVGFYAKGAAVGNALAILKAIAQNGQEDTGEDGEYVWINSRGNHPGDQEWFLSVFERLHARLGSK